MPELTPFTTVAYDASLPCNLRCLYCRNDWDSLPPGFPALEGLHRHLAALCRLGTRRIFYTGGELLLHPQWREVVLRGAELGFEQWVITNGLLLDRASATFLADHASGICLSFHYGDATTFERLTGRSGRLFPRLLESLHHLGDSGLPTTLFFSPLKGHNEGSVLDIVSLIQGQGVRLREVNVNRLLLREANRSAWELIRLGPREYGLLLDQLLLLRRRGLTSHFEGLPLCFLRSCAEGRDISSDMIKRCRFGESALALGQDGRFRLCPCAPEGLQGPGVEGVVSLEDLPDLAAFREGLWRHDRCEPCPDYHACHGGCHAVEAGLAFCRDPLAGS